MAVLRSKDGKELILNCRCGCDESLMFKVDRDDPDYYMVGSYISGNFYKDQDYTIWRVIKNKIKKIWCILMNKDFYYAEIILNGEDFKEFKEYINSVED